MFRHDPNVDIEHTRYLGRVHLTPVRLVEAFGPPSSSDGYKISGLYSFTDDQGNVFTVYDWKATSLYDDRSDVIGIDQTIRSPDEFWQSSKSVEFHVGGRAESDVAAFKSWLQGKTADTK